jgi:hypothetical protein
VRESTTVRGGFAQAANRNLGPERDRQSCLDKGEAVEKLFFTVVGSEAGDSDTGRIGFIHPDCKSRQVKETEEGVSHKSQFRQVWSVGGLKWLLLGQTRDSRRRTGSLCLVPMDSCGWWGNFVSFFGICWALIRQFGG